MKKRTTAPAKHRRVLAAGRHQLDRAVRTSHGRFVLGGLLVGLGYLPTYLWVIVGRAIDGAVSWFLVAGMVFVALSVLVQKRQKLTDSQASEVDQLLGHTLIVFGAIIFLSCRFAVWPQAIAWLVVLIGIATSTWGVSFFARFPIATSFIALTVYPRLGTISRAVWDFLVPMYAIETVMAQASAFLLRIIGYSAEANQRFIVLSKGAVEVGWGCNGLDMAITLAIAGLLVGLLFKLPRSQMVSLIAIGVVLALLANIPRLMLVTVAYVHWGKGWFDFWHGFWGGQLFSGVLFTIYYYVFLGCSGKSTTNLHTH